MSDNTVTPESAVRDALAGAFGAVAGGASAAGGAAGASADRVINDPLRGGPFTRATGPLNPAEDPAYQAYLRRSGAAGSNAAAAAAERIAEIQRQQGRFVDDADQARGRARQDADISRTRGLEGIDENFEARGLFRSGRRGRDRTRFVDDVGRDLGRSIYDINLQQHRRVEDDQLRIDEINEALARANAGRAAGRAAALERARRDAILRDAALGIIPNFRFDPRANREAQRPIDLGLEADLQRRFANRNRSDQLR